MSRAVGKYLQAIRDQRLILDEYRDFEADIEMFALTMAAVNGNTHVAAFGSQIADYHHNLDAAAQRIKHALDIGGVVDISDTNVGHDIRCLMDAYKTGAFLGSKQRARDNLLAVDFYDRIGKMPDDDIHVTKFAIPVFSKPNKAMSTDALHMAFNNPQRQNVVLASFKDNKEAVAYRLAVK